MIFSDEDIPKVREKNICVRDVSTERRKNLGILIVADPGSGNKGYGSLWQLKGRKGSQSLRLGASEGQACARVAIASRKFPKARSCSLGLQHLIGQTRGSCTV